ncbi:MAG: ferredoxin reductase [Ardenticatenaceae bacterium]|nr:ferredoxin reductase [Ardenticatenaceae bacterium]HBY98728.1 oxidoreductase [Chloroflexota bacterium]
MKRLLKWQIATVTGIKPETAQVKSFTLALPNWLPHRAGQHYDVRLTAPDGYQAQRSYSVASEPERAGEIDLTVERLEDGEVSSYMHDVLVVGDQIEVRGPIGGYFVWEATPGGPLLLIAGGSGVVPLMAMIRHRAAAGAAVPTRLLYSVRTPEDVIYVEELAQQAASDGGLDVFYTFTRAQPPGWTGYARRIDRQMLSEVAAPLGPAPQTFICGPTLFVETAANSLVQIGVAPQRIKTERFGPTGGIAS